MSIRVMTQVWDRSRHTGTDLLMLLALADFSDDQGHSYPAVSSLAAKCRMQPRNANYILKVLQESGELEVRANAGPKGTNRYRIVLAALGGVQSVAGVREVTGVQGVAGAGVQAGAEVQSSAPLQSSVGTPAIQRRLPLQPIADEPSLNRLEPSLTSLSRPQATKPPACPHAQIVQIYHEVLPELPRVKLMDSKARKSKTAEFWRWVLTSKKADGSARAADASQALEWIRAYFDRARSNDFLMGRGERSSQHASWRCDFDFLLTEKGRRQVIERTLEIAA